MADFLAPGDLSKALVGVGVNKAAIPPAKMIVLGILAGVYIGFAAHLATTIATGPFEWFGMKKFLIGAVFSCGLMLVIIPGPELWTGNNLMGVALFNGKIGVDGMLKNWGIVYLGNLIGSIMLAVFIAKMSGLANGPVGGTMINIAAGKTAAADGHNLQFFFRAICCNWLVCLAVMMAVAAKDIAGKVWAIFFPIMAFVASGFEHAIANMYFIPAGIFAKESAKAVTASGKTVEQLAGLNWGSMWTQNLVTVTLGNLVGGFIFVAAVYWFLYVRGAEEAK
jgi:formate/nitrite transporter